MGPRMDTTSTDYLELEGTVLPDGRIVWERLGMTAEPGEVTESADDSPIEAIQRNEAGEVVERRGLPVDSFNDSATSDLMPFPTSRRLAGAIPIRPDAHKLDIAIDGEVATRIGIPQRRPSIEHAFADDSDGRDDNETSLAGELDIRIVHPRAQQRHPLAPVLLEALVFVGEEMVAAGDATVHWFIGQERIASGRRSLWTDPKPGTHRLHVMVKQAEASCMAETRLSIHPKHAWRPKRRTGT
jgi:hypothetical protein